MANFFNTTCTNVGDNSKKHNLIADAFKKSALVLDWNSPQRGQFLLKCKGGVKNTDIRELVTSAAEVRVFVCDFGPSEYAYSLLSDRSTDTTYWLKRHGPEARKDRTISLSEEFERITVILPNGAEVQINENGEVFIQEEDTKPLQVRKNNSITKNLIR